MIADLDTARSIAETLHRHYPGHLWAVHASGETGIATIHNLRLSGRWGFVIRLLELQQDPGLRMVVRAGGELLERWALSRGPLQEQEMENRPRDLRGELMGDTGT